MRSDGANERRALGLSNLDSARRAMKTLISDTYGASPSLARSARLLSSQPPEVHEVVVALLHPPVVARLGSLCRRGCKGGHGGRW